jgi:hypothetical protein
MLLLCMVYSTYSMSANTMRGDIACSGWIKARQYNGWITKSNEDWLNGFMSGLNAGTTYDWLSNSDSNSNYIFVDNFCKNHPLGTVGIAGLNLANELKERARKK